MKLLQKAGEMLDTSSLKLVLNLGAKMSQNRLLQAVMPTLGKRFINDLEFHQYPKHGNHVCSKHYLFCLMKGLHVWDYIYKRFYKMYECMLKSEKF